MYQKNTRTSTRLYARKHIFRNQATFLRNDGRLNLEKVEACYQRAMLATNEGVQNVTPYTVIQRNTIARSAFFFLFRLLLGVQIAAWGCANCSQESVQTVHPIFQVKHRPLDTRQRVFLRLMPPFGREYSGLRCFAGAAGKPCKKGRRGRRDKGTKGLNCSLLGASLKSLIFPRF